MGLISLLLWPLSLSAKLGVAHYDTSSRKGERTSSRTDSSIYACKRTMYPSLYSEISLGMRLVMMDSLGMRLVTTGQPGSEVSDD